MDEDQEMKNAPVEVNTNEAAEQDAQNVLAELKGQAPATEAESPNPTKPAPTDGEDKEDAEIVAAAKKIGQDSSMRGRGQRTRGSGGGRGGKNVNYRENIKSDLTAGEQSSDPVEIRKQVGGIVQG